MLEPKARRRDDYLQTLGLDVYRLKDPSAHEWRELERRVSECRNCELHKNRKQTVFGVGDRRAEWLIIGEAPGAQEDQRGEPFVGRAGQLLNNMLIAMGLSRQKVFIANIVKCRPPNNRDPKPAEASACSAYLQAQIRLLHPRVILAVGRVAAQELTQTTTPIGKMRGHSYHYADSEIPLIVTYHPAYLLRSPTQKRKVWSDLRLAMRVYREAS